MTLYGFTHKKCGTGLYLATLEQGERLCKVCNKPMNTGDVFANES